MLTTKQVAKKYKLTEQRIRAIAKSRGIEPEMRIGRVCLWADGDLKKFKPGKNGVRRDRMPKKNRNP